MPLVINTNLDAINAQRNLTLTNIDLSKTLARLSSGKRINRAGDDAAGTALVNQFTQDIRGYRQAVNNAQDGLALLNVADGATQSIVSNLQRMRELAKQAANDTYGTTEKDLIQTELAQLKDEITRVANSTEFNGVKLINGSTPSNFRLQIGTGNDTTTTSVDLIDIASALGDLTASVGLSLGTVSVATFTAANELASRIDDALTTVNTRIAKLGAYQNRLDGVVTNLETSIQNSEAARSRIQDADIAFETAKLTRLQIIQQATLSILSQANVSPQSALTLLR